MTFNEATLESMLMITFLQPTAFAVPVIPHKISKELIGLTQLLTYLSRLFAVGFVSGLYIYDKKKRKKKAQ